MFYETCEEAEEVLRKLMAEAYARLRKAMAEYAAELLAGDPANEDDREAVDYTACAVVRASKSLKCARKAFVAVVDAGGPLAALFGDELDSKYGEDRLAKLAAEYGLL